MSADMSLSSAAGVVLSLKITSIFVYSTKLFLQWKSLYRDKPEKKVPGSVQVKLNGQHSGIILHK